MDLVRKVSEGLARTTSRRGFFGKGADVAFGALTGAAAGTAWNSRPASASGHPTVCAFPGPPCSCDMCMRADNVVTNGVCAKPCVIVTRWYANGCWTSPRTDGDVVTQVTCCDCTCPDIGSSTGWCGCGSDYHNAAELCPEIAGL